MRDLPTAGRPRIDDGRSNHVEHAGYHVTAAPVGLRSSDDPVGVGGPATHPLGAAVQFIDGKGLRALTVQRLGAYLGVDGMALYRYVPGREALLDGVVEVVVDELFGDPDVHLEAHAGWVDHLQRLAHGLRRIALAHPQVFPLVATRPPSAPWVRPPLRSLRWIESMLEVMTQSGFSDQDAAAAYRAFSSFLLGYLLLEVSARGVETGPVEEPDVSPIEDLSKYPILQRLEEHLSVDVAAQDFEEAWRRCSTASPCCCLTGGDRSG